MPETGRNEVHKPAQDRDDPYSVISGYGHRRQDYYTVPAFMFDEFPSRSGG